MIKDLLLVGIGSGIGGICRYLISVLMGYMAFGLMAVGLGYVVSK